MDSSPPPQVRRSVLDLDAVLGTSKDQIELALNTPDRTFTNSSSSSSSSGSEDGSINEDDNERGTSSKSTKRARRQRKELEREANAESFRRKRLFIIVCSAVPLFLTSISLAVVMKNTTNNNNNGGGGDDDDGYGATDSLSQAATATLGSESDNDAATPSASSPSSSTFLPTTHRPSAPPSPRPMVAAAAMASAISIVAASSPSGSSDDDGRAGQIIGGGLRATPSPAAVVAFDAEQYRPDVEWDVLVPTAAGTSSPISSFPTTAGGAAATRPTTARPACVAAGLPCPNRSEQLCCSDVCVRDRETGGQFCGAVEESPGAIANDNSNNDNGSENDQSEAIASWPQQQTSFPQQPVVVEVNEDDNNTMCVAANLPCPNRSEKLCCSDVCFKNKRTGELLCDALPAAAAEVFNKPNGNNNNNKPNGNINNSVGKDQEGTNTCVPSGNTCPSDKKLCCSGKCKQDVCK